MYPEYLMHYGVKGMKWGKKKKYNPEIDIRFRARHDYQGNYVPPDYYVSKIHTGSHGKFSGNNKTRTSTISQIGEGVYAKEKSRNRAFIGPQKEAHDKAKKRQTKKIATKAKLKQISNIVSGKGLKFIKRFLKKSKKLL